ncbi:outer membrane protein assembly factor BamA [Qingshengfaniella alkalisoli]|uniref:Outer membrane protein assembly factor BamA n=1 Tax=Qingshengfaniella alkalisoli TaxID=2599296 RepID=A0A5B8ISW8_9RHOB|nr:outer membrane protein assembly factor BamA [Qingshengfaniella alkalisoli]QDY69332.1 outer membrane protein assembly factor BamA [Qingshengfaniella alkalisoli]
MTGFGRKRGWIFAGVSAAALIGVMCTAPATAQGVNLSGVEVRGNQRIDSATVLTYAGLTPGQPVSAGELNAAYQRMVGSGLFEDVDLDVSGSRVIITVDEYPTINQISIEGNRRINDEALQELINSQPRRVYSPTTAENDARELTNAYRQAGRLEAVVVPKIIPRSQNRVDLVFEVSESRVVEIERIGFVGNRSYSDRRLRQVLETKQAGLFRALIRSDTFIEDRIQFDRQLLTDFYRSRGFVDFEVLSVAPEFSRERNAFFLTFNVQEGQRYHIGNISVSSEVPGLDPTAYRNILRIKAGQTYSPARIEDSVSRMERKALQDGLDFIRVDPRVTRNDRNQQLDFNFVLTRGERIFVERIDIEGNATTQDRVIRRQFDVVEGDPFNPREIRESAERIRALGYFSDAQVDAREGTQPDRVIVDVDVEEQPTGSLTFGVNYSVDDGPGLAIGLSERNFLGRGQLLNLSIAAGVDNADTALTFSDPALLGRDLRGTVDLYYRTSNNFSSDFDTRELGLVPSLEFPISENGRLELRYRLSQDEIKDVDFGYPDDSNDIGDNGSSAIIQREEGDRITSAVGYTYTYDTRRVGLDPNTGFQFRFSQDFAGLGGDNKYVKTTALLGAETKVWNEEIGLTAQLQGGSLNFIDGNSRVIDRFRAGNIRGFSRNGIGPRDLTATNEDALGGNYMAALSLEADFPIGLPEEYGFRGGVFFDAGSVWGLDDTAGTGGEVDDSFHLRTVVGASLFWTTPIGPLRFDFTKALDKEDYDDERTFDLTVSTRF